MSNDNYCGTRSSSESRSKRPRSQKNRTKPASNGITAVMKSIINLYNNNSKCKGSTFRHATKSESASIFYWELTFEGFIYHDWTAQVVYDLSERVWYVN